MRDTQRLFKFALVGGVGFIVDTSVFYCSLNLFAWSLWHARVVAFLWAATATWLGNRCFTFADCKADKGQQSYRLIGRQWAKFLLSATLSAIPNFLVFKLTIMFIGEQGIAPYLALVAGISVGMIGNFAFSRYWVFGQPTSIKKAQSKQALG